MANSVRDKSISVADRCFEVFNTLFLTLLALVIIYPLWYILIASVTDPAVVNTGKMLLIPTPDTWFTGGYERILSYTPLWSGYVNTVKYTVLGTAISIFATIPTGYVLSRNDMAGANPITFLFTFTMFFQGGMVPTYLLIKNIGLYDTIWAIVLPSAVSVWNLIICRTFFQSNIPRELLEASVIDGCDDFKFFFKIVLPLSSTIIAVMVLFYSTAMWNSYFSALIYLADDDKMPLQMVFRNLILINQVTGMTQDVTEMMWRQKLAEQLKYGIIIVAALPLLCFYPFVQKYFAKGVMIGAIKG